MSRSPETLNVKIAECSVSMNKTLPEYAQPARPAVTRTVRACARHTQVTKKRHKTATRLRD